MRDVTDRVAVVTGAASGIGRGMAQSFAAAGMKVVLSDVEQRPLEVTFDELEASGADVHAVVCDVSKQEHVSALAEESLRRYGAVHILCNNAGVGTEARPSWNASIDDWNWVLGVNLMGVIHGVRSFVPRMIEQCCEAHIVNTASLAGVIYGENTIYAVSKFGVVGLSESLQLELARAGHNIKVSVLCPAWVNTNIIDAGRNRPANATPVEPRKPLHEVFANWVADQIGKGLDPRAVGDQVLDAIRQERFYVFTHPEWQSLIEHRNETLLSAANPTSPQTPGTDALMRELSALGHERGKI